MQSAKLNETEFNPLSLCIFHFSLYTIYMICICPECKNQVDLTPYPNLAPGMVIECDHCGMTLLVKEIVDNTVKTAVVDEGK